MQVPLSLNLNTPRPGLQINKNRYTVYLLLDRFSNNKVVCIVFLDVLEILIPAATLVGVCTACVHTCIHGITCRGNYVQSNSTHPLSPLYLLGITITFCYWLYCPISVTGEKASKIRRNNWHKWSDHGLQESKLNLPKVVAHIRLVLWNSGIDMQQHSCYLYFGCLFRNL